MYSCLLDPNRAVLGLEATSFAMLMVSPCVLGIGCSRDSGDDNDDIGCAICMFLWYLITGIYKALNTTTALTENLNSNFRG